MTIHASEAARTPLTTESSKVARIRDLIAPANSPSQLWLMLLDRDGYQLPVLIPISERPPLPEPTALNGLLARITSVAAHELDPGFQAMFVLERLGPFGATSDDHCWAAALEGACARADVRCAGTFLLSPGGVSAVFG